MNATAADLSFLGPVLGFAGILVVVLVLVVVFGVALGIANWICR